MMKALLLCLFAAGPTCCLIATELAHSNESAHRAYNKLAAVKLRSKRNIIHCHDNTEYLFITSSGAVCCESCPPGHVAEDHGCTKENPKTSCKKCPEGIEYMDHYNYIRDCLRCSGCDAQHGMEVEKNCTITQNTKCKCIPDFFCATMLCDHCTQCDRCADSRVLEPCTGEKNTKCAEKGESRKHVMIICVIILLVVAVLSYIMWRRNSKRNNLSFPTEDETDETEPLTYPDIDLRPYITDIAEEMTLEEILRFVRKQRVPSNRIEEVKMDNQNNAAESKIKLLELWYQKSGIQGAYGTLITTLKKLDLRSAAESIEGKINSARSAAARQPQAAELRCPDSFSP